jgi:hypothetical protein
MPPNLEERIKFPMRVFYPRTAAEVLALDILHDNGGRHVTRATVEHHLGRLSAHRSNCSCWRCEAAAKADAGRVYDLPKYQGVRVVVTISIQRQVTLESANWLALSS